MCAFGVIYTILTWHLYIDQYCWFHFSCKAFFPLTFESTKKIIVYHLLLLILEEFSCFLFSIFGVYLVDKSHTTLLIKFVFCFQFANEIRNKKINNQSNFFFFFWFQLFDHKYVRVCIVNIQISRFSLRCLIFFFIGPTSIFFQIQLTEFITKILIFFRCR